MRVVSKKSREVTTFYSRRKVVVSDDVGLPFKKQALYVFIAVSQ